MNNAAATYRAFAFHPDLGTEVASGTIHFQPGTLTFTCEAGKVDLPLNTVQLRFEESRIFFRDPNQPEWRVYTPDFEILENRIFIENSNLRAQTQETEQTTGLIKLVAISGGFFVSFILVVMLVFWMGGFAMRYVINKVPVSYENEIGETILAKLRKKDLLLNDTNRIAELSVIGDRIVSPEMKQKFKADFYLVNIPIPNAFATPGGKVFVFTGLLDTINHEEELAGVLAHEIAHVNKRHHLRQSISNVGTYAALRMSMHGNSSLLNAVAAGSELLFQNGFSQSLENEADDAGFDYLVKANVDPRGLANALEKIEAEASRGQTNLPNVLQSTSTPMKALSTHPATLDRLSKLGKKWKKLPKKTGFQPIHAKDKVSQ